MFMEVLSHPGGFRFCIVSNMFQFLEDVSASSEASSLLTNWREVAGV